MTYFQAFDHLTCNFVLYFAENIIKIATILAARALLVVFLAVFLLFAYFRLVIMIIMMLELLLAIETNELSALRTLLGENRRLVTNHALKYFLHTVCVVEENLEFVYFCFPRVNLILRIFTLFAFCLWCLLV